jgi:hypothetical protein
MPLVKCAECQQPVSTTAATCPNCGASVKYKPSLSFVLFVLIVIGLIAAGVISVFISIQNAERAKAKFNDDTRGAAVYTRIFSTPSPAMSPALANSKVSEPAAPPPPPPQTQIYRTAVLKRPTTFQLPYGNVTLPRGSQLEFVSRDESEVRVRYRNHQQSIRASDVDLR